jgi:hypothetical protein
MALNNLGANLENKGSPRSAAILPTPLGSAIARENGWEGKDIPPPGLWIFVGASRG